MIENYLEADGTTVQPGFPFIMNVPTGRETSKAIAGEVGDYIVTAPRQRGSDDWFLGAITDENARDVSFKLDFLDKGKKYEAQIHRDGEKAEWKTNPYNMLIERKVVTAADSLKFKLATSGGAAIRFKAL